MILIVVLCQKGSEGTGGLGDWETGRLGDWEIEERSKINPLKPKA
jgi:hypothetical protein